MPLIDQACQCRVDLGLRARQGKSCTCIGTGIDGRPGAGQIHRQTPAQHRQLCRCQIAIDVVHADRARACEGERCVLVHRLPNRYRVHRCGVAARDGDGQGGGIGDQATGVLDGIAENIVGAGAGSQATGAVGDVAVAASGVECQMAEAASQ